MENPQSKAKQSQANLAFLGGFSDELQKIAFATVPSITKKVPSMGPPSSGAGRTIKAVSTPTPHALVTEGNLTSNSKNIPPPPVG